MPPEDGENGTVETAQDAPATTTENAEPNDETKPEADDYAELKSALAKERESAKAATKQLKAAEKRLQDLENAGKPEVERLAAERDEYKAKLDELTGMVRESTARDAVFEQAQKMGATNPQAVWRIVRNDLTFDDDGGPTNLAAVMKEAKELAPALFRPSPSADGANGASSPPPTANWLREAMLQNRR